MSTHRGPRTIDDVLHPFAVPLCRPGHVDLRVANLWIGTQTIETVCMLLLVPLPLRFGVVRVCARDALADYLVLVGSARFLLRPDAATGTNVAGNLTRGLRDATLDAQQTVLHESVLEDTLVVFHCVMMTRVCDCGGVWVGMGWGCDVMWRQWVSCTRQKDSNSSSA